MEELKTIRKLGVLATMVANEVAKRKGKKYDTGEEFTRVVIRKLPRQKISILNFHDLQIIFTNLVNEIYQKNLIENQEIKKLLEETSEGLLLHSEKIKKLPQHEIAFNFCLTEKN